MSLSRWHTGTKAKTLIALKEGGATLYPELSDIMSQVEDKNDVKDWDITLLECRICGHRHLVVVPYEMSDVGNECLNCGERTADVAEEERSLLMNRWAKIITLLLWLLKKLYPASAEKKEAKIEILAKEIEKLTEKYNDAHKKWQVAVATGSPEHTELWDVWMSVTKNLARTERQYKRLTGKASDIS